MFPVSGQPHMARHQQAWAVAITQEESQEGGWRTAMAVRVEDMQGGLYAAKHQRSSLRNMKTPTICYRVTIHALLPAQIHMIPSGLVFGGEAFGDELVMKVESQRPPRALSLFRHVRAELP